MLRRQHFPKLVGGFNTIPIKIPAGFSSKTDKLITKFIWQFKGPRIDRTILKKKNKVGGFPLSDLKF